jgi:hypothetical protein
MGLRARHEGAGLRGLRQGHRSGGACSSVSVR